VWLVALFEQVAQRAYGLHGSASLRIAKVVIVSVVAKEVREELVSSVALRPACFSEHHEGITGFDVIAHFELTEFRQVQFLFVDLGVLPQRPQVLRHRRARLRRDIDHLRLTGQLADQTSINLELVVAEPAQIDDLLDRRRIFGSVDLKHLQLAVQKRRGR